MTKGMSLTAATAQAQGMIYGMVQRQASMLAFVDNFRLLGAAMLIIIPLLFLMKKTAPKKEGRRLATSRAAPVAAPVAKLHSTVLRIQDVGRIFAGNVSFFGFSRLI